MVDTAKFIRVYDTFTIAYYSAGNTKVELVDTLISATKTIILA